MPYSGVFIEKVFSIFWDDRVSVMDKENKPTSKSSQPLWGLAIVDKGINDWVSVGVDWDVARTPTDHDQGFGKEDEPLYKAKITEEGADLYSPLGKITPLAEESGIIKGSMSFKAIAP
jgi:hypothetical protein